MNERFVFVEFQFPQDIKDLYWGEPGTAILKMLLDQYIQETDCFGGKLLFGREFDDVAIYVWNKNKFAFTLQFVNLRDFNKWKEHRINFIAWLKDTHDIEQTFIEEYSDVKITDLEDQHNLFWKKRKYFFEDIPEQKGYNPHNIISGAPVLSSDNNR